VFPVTNKLNLHIYYLHAIKISEVTENVLMFMLDSKVSESVRYELLFAGGYEELCLLRYNAVRSDGSQSSLQKKNHVQLYS
jgi:hypothetical protein